METSFSYSICITKLFKINFFIMLINLKLIYTMFWRSKKKLIDLMWLDWLDKFKDNLDNKWNIVWQKKLKWYIYVCILKW
jgi:hypothetical protein